MAMGKSKSYVSMLLSISKLPQDLITEDVDTRILYELSKREDLSLDEIKDILKHIKGMSRSSAIRYIRQYKRLTVKQEEKKPVKKRIKEEVEVEEAPEVRTCFICKRTFTKKDVQLVPLCPFDLSLVSGLVRIAEEKGIQFKELKEMIEDYIRSKYGGKSGGGKNKT